MPQSIISPVWSQRMGRCNQICRFGQTSPATNLFHPQLKEKHQTVVDVSSIPPSAADCKVNLDAVICNSALSNTPDTTTSQPLCSSLKYPQTDFCVRLQK